MSTPSSRQSNPPNFKDQAIILPHKVQMSNSEEEVQLLEEYNGGDDGGGKAIDVPLPSGKSRYCSAPFLWFVCASTILPLAVVGCTFMIAEPDTPFSLAFVLGMVTAVVGGCYFVPFMALRSVLHDTHKVNLHKRLNVNKLRNDIGKMNRFRTELENSKAQILKQNKETKALVKQLQGMNVNSLDELSEQKGKAQKVYQEWFHQLIKKERNLLHTLYDRFEFQDNSPGMTRAEFDNFVKHLPEGYEERMERLGTYDKLSHGGDLILYEDFKSALDVFAEMELNDEDIDFELEKQETGTDESGKKRIVSAIVKKTKSVKNKWLNKSNKEP